MNRRDAMMGLLFGGGMLGLRSIASGLPAALLTNPRRALADVPASCNAASRAQFVIFNTSAQGDPIGNNAPGTYADANPLDSNIVHPNDPQMALTNVIVGGKSWQAAAPWASLGATLQRTTFFHLMTNTPIHPKEHDVLQLMGSALNNEMFPSLIAQAMAPCLGTLQAQPVSVGGAPGETLTYRGAALPTIPPTALAATLKSTAAVNLVQLRDKTLDTIMDVYKNGASAAQRQYIDSLVTSSQQVRGIDQSVLGSITSLKDNGVGSQIAAAIALVKMKVSPVIALHIPFGSDNHSDANLATETSETVSGMASLASLFQQLATAGLQDQVSFVSLNVFGRTMGASSSNGRNHNPNHQLSLAIGKPFASAVIGGVAPVAGDYGATAISSASGASSASGDIAAVDTLGAFAQSTLAALGADPQWIATNVTGGKIVPAMIA